MVVVLCTAEAFLRAYEFTVHRRRGSALFLYLELYNSLLF
jgi:hypothetical protein